MRQEKVISNETSDIMYNFLVFFPLAYNKNTIKKKWPLLVFLHGAFERGNNLDDLKREALPKLAVHEDFPFVIVAPQCPQHKHWIASQVLALTHKAIADYQIDTSQVYLTGLSMGGFATWQVATKYPNTYAAIIPVCGGGNPAYASKLVNLPIWAFHGEKDRVIPVEQSIEMIDAIHAAGGDAKLTVYPHAYHDAWTETYLNKEIYEWLLQHKK